MQQIYWRLYFRLFTPPFHQPTDALLLKDITYDGLPWLARPESLISSDVFKFLNISHNFSAGINWNTEAHGKLWTYNLHYFDDLNAIDSPSRSDWHRALIVRWIAENAVGDGVGWESYPTSLRIVNWIKWLISGNDPVPGMLRSLFVQADWLSRRLERHLLGNHLFANAKALVFAGLFFAGDRPAKWLDTGLKIVSEELPEQVLVDGGNFELSPMYHAIFLEDVLDLINATRYWPGVVRSVMVDSWRETAARMTYWLIGMTHPDGEISFFNDSAMGIASKPSDLLSYAEKLEILLGFCSGGSRFRRGVALTASGTLAPNPSLVHYQDSGYVRMEGETFTALLDVARVGPDYLPGHAHADTLSFELSAFSQRVIVNSGTSFYGTGAGRSRERGTAAHSTVEVARANSSEVWGGFRVARRAYPFDLDVRSNSCYVACSHSGYTRLPGAPVHRRAWQMNKDGFQVRDTVRGGKHKSLARYILHPDIHVSAVDATSWHLTLNCGQRLRLFVKAGLGQLEPARYSPEFGKQRQTNSIVIELIEGVADVTLSYVE